MPIKSYLLTPLEGLQAPLMAELAQIEGCEVMPSTNHQLIVLVTDTASKAAEKALLNQLEQLNNLKDISLVSGYDI